MAGSRGTLGMLGICTDDHPGTLSVLVGCDQPAEQEYLTAALEARGITVERFVGGYAAAEVPLDLLRVWYRPWTALYRCRPDRVISTNHIVTTPPHDTLHASAEGTPLTEVARLIRTHDGKTLPDSVGTGKDTRVGILDTGINPQGASLKRALTERVSFAPNEDDVADHRGHGTSVAACVVAVARQIEIWSIKVLNRNGSGTLLSVLRGIDYAVKLSMPDHQGRLRAASGTSFSAPLTTGIFASCIGLAGKKPSRVEDRCDLIRKTCVPPATGTRDPNAVGAGLANLERAADRLGSRVHERSARRLVAGLRRGLVRAAAVAVILVLAFSAWGLLIDHVANLGAEGTRPAHVFLRAKTQPQPGRLLPVLPGMSRFQLLCGTEDEAHD